MSSSKPVVLLALVLVTLTSEHTLRFVYATTKCTYLRSYSLETADCSNKDLRIVPTDLHTNIQVLDLSKNRFRHILNNSFEQYTSLTILYLSENSIYKIDYNAFKPLSSLGVLDLSSNALRDLSIYFPSTLYRLYLSENPMQNFTITRLSSLKGLSFGDEELHQMPNLGISPSLLELNVSVSPLKKLTPLDLAPFCKLEYLYVNPENLFTDRSNETLCSCLKLEEWTRLRNIHVRSFLCKYEKTTKIVCNTDPDQKTLQVYNACLSEYQFRQIPTIVLTSAGILAALIILCVVIYYRCRRKKTKQRSPVRTGSAQADTNLHDSTVRFMNDGNVQSDK